MKLLNNMNLKLIRLLINTKQKSSKLRKIIKER